MKRSRSIGRPLSVLLSAPRPAMGGSWGTSCSLGFVVRIIIHYAQAHASKCIIIYLYAHIFWFKALLENWVPLWNIRISLSHIGSRMPFKLNPYHSWNQACVPWDKSHLGAAGELLEQPLVQVPCSQTLPIRDTKTWSGLIP